MALKHANQRNARFAQFKPRKSSNAQAAIEYLTTYGWAILIIAVVVSLLYAFVFAPSFITPQKCTFASGANCNDVIIGTSSTASKIVLLLSNSQQYSMDTPRMTINMPDVGNVTGTCSD